MRRSATVPAAALTALLLVGSLAACSAGASGGGSSAASSEGSRGSVDFQSGDGTMPSVSGQSASGGGSASASGKVDRAAAADRAIVRTGTLQLVADRPIAVADRIETLVDGAGGRVARSQEDPSGRTSADLQLRIPAERFDAALTAIKELGDVRDVSVDATDVTARVTDYAVRIANLRASIARLQQLLAKADSSSALVTIEGALTDRQTSLEQLLAEQKTLADQVSYATLTVSVVTPAAAPAKGPQDFVSGLVVGARGLWAAVAATAIGLGVALPWIVLIGAIGAAAVAIRRAVRRRVGPTSA